MTNRELDALLNGAPGAALTLNTGDRVYFSRHELVSPVARRAALRRKLGHTGYQPPVYDEADHDTFVRVCFQLADAVEEERSAKPPPATAPAPALPASARVSRSVSPTRGRWCR